ncbi:XRE family transcriptional regulator [Deinococcus sp.]|uniref:XRE family transcriptional regulator n=1 Tax=Deinococcus sp. TaxID=47478 RepID=UPI0025DDCCF5|nr:XRE family transcriptional regulator [Deinococcus sp.]
MTDLEHSLESALKEQMRRKGLTNAELARRLGVKPPHVSRVLSRQSGRIPESLADVLTELGLKLTVAPLAPGEASPRLTAAGVPYTGDAETDAVLNDFPDILERVARLERGESRLIPIEEIAAKYGLKL